MAPADDISLVRFHNEGNLPVLLLRGAVPVGLIPEKPSRPAPAVAVTRRERYRRLVLFLMKTVPIVLYIFPPEPSTLGYNTMPCLNLAL